MKKWIAKLVITGALLGAFVLPTLALTVTVDPTNRFFINDFSNVITSSDEEAIYEAGVQLFQKTGAQVVAVTVPSLDGADASEYALELGRDWGVGDAKNDTGVVLLLASDDREVTIQVGYGLEGALTDMQSGILLDTYALPHFQSNDFSSGIKDTYMAIINEVYLEFGMEADPNYTPVEELENDSSEIWAFLGAILLMIVLSSLSRGRFPLFFFPFGGHYHGGGFGSGGGNFGGFSGSGGSFGGGGASRRF